VLDGVPFRKFHNFCLQSLLRCHHVESTHLLNSLFKSFTTILCIKKVCESKTYNIENPSVCTNDSLRISDEYRTNSDGSQLKSINGTIMVPFRSIIKPSSDTSIRSLRCHSFCSSRSFQSCVTNYQIEWFTSMKIFKCHFFKHFIQIKITFSLQMSILID